jgi:hypothetical protein
LPKSETSKHRANEGFVEMHGHSVEACVLYAILDALKAQKRQEATGWRFQVTPDRAPLLTVG